MIWIIGGTSGIGKAIALALSHKHGTAVDGIESMDVRDTGQVRDRLRTIVREGILHNDPLTGIVYSAGANELSWLGEMGEDGIQDAMDILDVNVAGFWRVLDQLVSENLVPPGWWDGFSVLAITSDAARRPLRTSTAYCASKAALEMTVRTAARELSAVGIRVNGLAPGMTEGTKMTAYIDKRVPEVRGWTPAQAIEYEIQQEVMPGRVTPEELAEVAVAIMNGPCHWTGDIVTVNGGR